VLPSHYEASAISYAEAGAAGLPCIGTTKGGSASLIGEAGILVDPGDEDALVDAMLVLVDPTTASRLGALAEARSTLFTWRAVAERILRALALPSVPLESFAEFLEPSASSF
jgi:glycosyltransferase involved in cell wall biosynthesis